MASRTLIQDDLTWSGSTLLPAADAIGAVCELRARDGKALQVMGSASLAAQLIEHDLVDEYRLMIEPILLGRGTRGMSSWQPWRLAEGNVSNGSTGLGGAGLIVAPRMSVSKQYPVTALACRCPLSVCD